jgi:hypothetical protein
MLLTMVFAFSASAQIQFTRADVESRIAATQITSYNATDAEGKTFDLSGPIYDLTVFQTTSMSFATNYVDPSLTTWPHEFPAATHAQEIATTEGSAYIYLRLDDVGLYALGVGSEVQGTDFLLKYVPEQPEMLFPFKKGSAWTYTSGLMTPFEGMTMTEHSDVSVVAEGTLRTPDGDHACIVVRQMDRSTTKLEFGGQVISESYTTSISYEFMTKTGISATVVIDTLDESSNTPTLVDASWAVTGTQTSAHGLPVASELRIESTYPNPARGGTVAVEWSSAAAGEVQLAVVDAYGRVYRTLRQGAAPQGRFSDRMSVGDLPSGQYFIRLIQGSEVAIRPLTVVH